MFLFLEIFRPMDMDCHLITFEKFSIHRLLLRSYDVIDEIECCQVQDPQDVEWGTNGFIMMEQRKFLIKSIVELKVYKCFQKRSTTLKCIFIHEYLCRGHEYPQPSQGDDVLAFEDFENFFIKLLAVALVIMTVECLLSLVSLVDKLFCLVFLFGLLVSTWIFIYVYSDIFQLKQIVI